jgi:hypothetical protein
MTDSQKVLRMTVDEALADVERWTGETKLSGPAGIRARILAVEVRRLRKQADSLLGDASLNAAYHAGRERGAGVLLAQREATDVVVKQRNALQALVLELEAENASLREYKAMYEGLCK